MCRNNKDLNKWLKTGNFASENEIAEFIENASKEAHQVAFSDDKSNSSDLSGDVMSEYNESDYENVSMADFIVKDENKIDDDASYED